MFLQKNPTVKETCLLKKAYVCSRHLVALPCCIVMLHQLNWTSWTYLLMQTKMYIWLLHRTVAIVELYPLIVYGWCHNDIISFTDSEWKALNTKASKQNSIKEITPTNFHSWILLYKKVSCQFFKDLGHGAVSPSPHCQFLPLRPVNKAHQHNILCEQ